jgi:putative inorganic carbon (HCO3(-)) transporter
MISRYETLVNYEQDESAEARLWSWEFCKRVGLARPFTGGGFDFYTPDAYQTYFPEFVDYWSHKLTRVLYWSCHSMWLTVLGEHGLLAFFLWIALLACCFLSFRRMRSDAARYPELGWLLPYAQMLQIGFVVYMISGTFLDVAYFDVFFQLIGVVISANEISKKIKQELPAVGGRVTNVAFARAI